LGKLVSLVIFSFPKPLMRECSSVGEKLGRSLTGLKSRFTAEASAAPAPDSAFHSAVVAVVVVVAAAFPSIPAAIVPES
jgi:hypothetical protein